MPSAEDVILGAQVGAPARGLVTLVDADRRPGRRLLLAHGRTRDGDGVGDGADRVVGRAVDGRPRGDRGARRYRNYPRSLLETE